jgi:hypothetical protein
MMALPYITEHTGFTGTVYATEPTMQIGRWEVWLPSSFCGHCGVWYQKCVIYFPGQRWVCHSLDTGMLTGDA